ncbi:Rossmann-fold NAD(P)-binding domain-containing protein [Glycomyces xiaoerkulensis]|uniref:saccharopine dehydrogenase n=1 Tax=Glycomyces xiaoerkulensis TaxID=2038139 RepID=UPI000C264DAC|nr:saccharopine dehydrogenase [Glycomyces xiaoerkulensis]
MNRIWLRHEHHPDETRTPLTPQDARRLIADGIPVHIERSDTRCFPDEEYRRAGCRLEGRGHWPAAPADALVLGLKALPGTDRPVSGRHAYFGHCYKGQPGAGDLLGRFAAGGGELLDLESLTDAAGRRVAAFGYWAGFTGAALAMLHWNGRLEAPLEPTERSALVASLRRCRRPVRVLVTGSAGRCGRGAREALAAAGVEATGWDVEETRDLDREALTDHDLLINAVLTDRPTEPFLSRRHLDPGGRLSLVADVTCDVGTPYHLLPFYRDRTSWAAPVADTDSGVAVIAIDNLPSLLPRESSSDFSRQLLPYLLDFPRNESWARSRGAFRDALAESETTHA